MEARLANYKSMQCTAPAPPLQFMALPHPTTGRIDVYEIGAVCTSPELDELYLAHDGNRFRLCMFVSQPEPGFFLVKYTICEVQFEQQPDYFFFTRELRAVRWVGETFANYTSVLKRLQWCGWPLVVPADQFDPWCIECSLFGLAYELRPCGRFVHLRVRDPYEGWSYECPNAVRFTDIADAARNELAHILVACHEKLADIKHFLVSLHNADFMPYREHDAEDDCTIDGMRFECNHKTWVVEFDTGRCFVGMLRPKRKRLVEVATLAELKRELFGS